MGFKLLGKDADYLKNNNEYIVSLLSKIIFVGLSFTNSIIINRYLGPELRGEYAYILNLSNILTIVIGFNIASSYPYFSKKYGTNIIQKFINILFFQTGIYSICAIIFSLFLQDELVISLIVISIIGQFSNQLDFLSIITNVNKRNIIIIISAFIYSSILIFIFFNTENSLEYIIGVLLIYNLIKIFLYICKNKFIPSKNLSTSIPLSEVLKFSSFPMIISLLSIFNYNIDVVILKLFVDNGEIGIYSVGVTLASMLWIIPDAFKDVLFNKTAKSDSIKAINFSIKINVYISLIVIIGFVIIGKTFITLVYGVDYIDAFNVTVVLLIGTVPMIFFKMVNTLYQAIGKQKFSFYILFISVMINVIVTFLIVPLLGIMGAAISSVISYLICGIIMLISFINKYDLRFKDIFLLDSIEKNKIKSVILRKG
jgi:O-antigen/teichoic acid export membrane protein